ncbi:DNA mismatch repair protein Msh6 [Anabrus simplex]|uniref:DNA mismatch repair protein Msh6 n=1 Tax=Anabrus simplex TaxID=316456 RepID=UPI0035A26A8F
MSQKNTLWNYFGSPTPRKSISNEENRLSTIPNNEEKQGVKKRPSESPAPKKKKTSAGSTPVRSVATFTPKRKSTSPSVNLYDVVWSKLEGYPWWPSLICNHPKQQTYIRGNEIHVQFFDDPPTRAWIKKPLVEPYNSSMDKPVPNKEVEKWKHATTEADNAVKLTVEERKKLLFDFSKDDISDDDREEEEEEEDDGESDASGTDKENIDSKSPPKKRRRIIIPSDSEDEYKPVEEAEVESESASSGVDSALEDEGDVSEEELPDSPKKKQKRDRRAKPTKTPSGKSPSTPSHQVSPATKAKLSMFPATPEPKEVTATDALGSGGHESWTHLKLDFLNPVKIRDAMRRTPDHPDYDPKTLYVPEDFKKNLTPAMKQWWDVKAKHFDCVLFFKVGKFYELYHMDAVIGVNELGLLFMKGEWAHSGFPEIAYGRYSASLVEKGYKIARVEQTETPDMMAERCKGLFKVTKFDKVVKREICQITSKGTRTFSVLDGEAREAETNYLLALTEQVLDSSTSSYGVCFIDTSIGVFHLGQFTDDRYCSRLRTLIAHHPPVQVLYERNVLSERTRQLMGSVLAAAVKESLATGSEFWPADKTLVTLAEGEYFPRATSSGGVAWPEAFKQFLNEADSLGLSARDECELAVRALGACVWYLQRCHLEQQLLALGKFKEYKPVDKLGQPVCQERSESFAKYMVLDGTTLNNLDILQSAGEEKGSLLKRLDFCCTPFGKRLLRQWICSPLCDVAAIKSRQDAISELLRHIDLMKEARALLAGLPDLERLLATIHAQGNAVRSKTHPDSRAIFYEEHIYSKRKILDFLSALSGFKSSMKIAALFQDSEADISSKLLVQCTAMASAHSHGKFPDMSSSLDFFDSAFDHEEAQKEGRIIPSSGVDPEYDAVMEELKLVNRELQDYLEEQRRFFGCKVSYFGSDKKRFQIEVPDSAARKVGNDYELQSQKKGFKRYWTAKTKELLSRLMTAENQKKNILKDLSRRIFEQFSTKYEQWNTAVQCLAVLDVLMSLAEYSRSEEGDLCVPEFILPSKDVKPFVKIIDGRHPCISSMDGFIPNDTLIGCKDETGDGSDASLVLVTGPNMGGKSTLMRQLGLLTIMAHMGCHIPAVSCQLTPVDRIFTRLGATDDIMAGESTFYVELSETSAIFHQATQHSLVLVDELGRGTSTYDGTAIAAAVVRELSQLGCRTLFSTHYHTLVEDFKNLPTVTLGHMACMVENEDDSDPSQETVTFLYKFAAGACPKSYGFNAARLGGIPAHIITEGHRKAAELERESHARKLFRSLCGKQIDGVSQLCRLLKEIV